MIVYDLSCATHGHRFEGWFSNSEDFARQADGGLVECPHCGCPHISKAPMAPAVSAKGNGRAAVPQTDAARRAAVMDASGALQKKALKDSRWVGDRFSEEARAMHYGERDSATIHGRATLDDAREMHEEGIALAALPFPVAPPDELN